MRRSWPVTLTMCGLIFPSVALAADPAPSVDRIRSAAAEYDAGRRAFTDKHFEEAAIHFENAYRDAPNAQALRSAMRARRDAGQLARAASLAAIAQAKYASDAPTAAASKEALADGEAKLHRLTVVCESACSVAADGRLASVEAGVKQVLFLDPGGHDLIVSWSAERSTQLHIDARAGGRKEVVMTAPPMPVVEPQVVGLPVQAGVQAVAPVAPPVAEKPLHRAIFVAGIGVTAVAGGVLVWSGIDTLNNPGVAAVRAQCVDQGESCPAYQTGRSAQLRTNVLVGVTAGLGVVTGVIGLFFTRWSPRAPEPAVARIVPTFSCSQQGGGVGLSGAF